MNLLHDLLSQPEPGAFALLRREGREHLELLRGPLTVVPRLADIPLPDGAGDHTLAVVPFWPSPRRRCAGCSAMSRASTGRSWCTFPADAAAGDLPRPSGAQPAARVADAPPRRAVAGRAAGHRPVRNGSPGGLLPTFTALSPAGEPASSYGPIELSRAPGGEVHALRGPGFAGVRFHPESVLTEHGSEVLTELIGGLLPRRAPVPAPPTAG